MNHDSISNMCTVIRNGYMRKKTSVTVQYSKVLLELATLLVDEGYLTKVEQKTVDAKPTLTMQLKYQNNQPAILSIKRISKPSLRKYVGFRDIKPLLRGLGTQILTTSKGLKTDLQAKTEKIGGELLISVE